MKSFCFYLDIDNRQWWVNPDHIVGFVYPNQFKPTPGKPPIVDVYTTSSGDKPLFTVNGYIEAVTSQAEYALGWLEEGEDTEDIPSVL